MPAMIFSQQFNGSIWRLEIDPITYTLFAELRDEKAKQVSFASLDLKSGGLNFNAFKADERWLIGMETAYDGALLLHYFESPGSPAHKGLTAVNSGNAATLWTDHNLSFDHLSKAGPICFDGRLQPRKYFLVDIKTGKQLLGYQPQGGDFLTGTKVPQLVPLAEFEDVTLPGTPVENLLHSYNYKSLRIVSLHTLKEGKLNQLLYIFDGSRPVFKAVLNNNIQKLQPEAFVIHGQYLISIKNKNELLVIDLEEDIRI